MFIFCRVTYDTIRTTVMVDETIIDNIESRRLLWFGHSLRMNDKSGTRKKLVPNEKRKKGFFQEFVRGVTSAMHPCEGDSKESGHEAKPSVTSSLESRSRRKLTETEDLTIFLSSVFYYAFILLRIVYLKRHFSIGVVIDTT